MLYDFMLSILLASFAAMGIQARSLSWKKFAQFTNYSWSFRDKLCRICIDV